MKILKECNLSEAVVELLAGKTMIFPTETSYGLGCDATSQAAADAIFKIKGRSDDKPLLVVVPNVAMAKEYLVWNKAIDVLANTYWPGPLTVVGLVKENSGLAKGVVSTLGTVAVRVSPHPIVKFLTESLGKPLVATSANISGAANIYSGTEAEAVFSNSSHQPDIILDGGVLPPVPPTTLVDATGDEIKILRQGELKIEI